MDNVTKRGVWISASAAVIVVVLVVVAIVMWTRQGVLTAAEPEPTETVAAETPTPTPTPTIEGPAPNDEEYEAGDLPLAEVFMINPELPVDDAPEEKTLGISATPASGEGAPVFADPEGEPVAWLPQEDRYGGTTVPVIEQHDAWVRVMLVGRQSLPGSGDASQLTGWLRVDDVTLEENNKSVEVNLSERTIEIVTGTGDDATRETIASDFAWGQAATPTPTGRSFIMLTEVTDLAYTYGNPIVYLSVQSPTLDGFDGQDVAVTAFHYHDVRSGAISNGCLRVGVDANSALAELPAGTPVYIS